MENKSQIFTYALLITFLLLISNLKSSTATAATATTTTTTTTTSAVMTAAAKSTSKTYKNYLKSACNSTTYPKLCYKSLSSYSTIIKTNDLVLCTTALNESLQDSIKTSSLITDLLTQKRLSKTEAEVVKDCIDEIGDSIDELNQSLSELGNLKFNSSYAKFQISNIKTWVSAVITDEYTCIEGFEDSNVRYGVRKKIQKSVLNVARMTSNALALINCKYNY